MLEQTARELVLKAGHELVSSGLIARTWGNVSCRIDKNTFVITPSGRSYETLKPEELVLCKVEDASYEGTIKPSSERGIHALIYRTYPDMNFVIHTHQPEASGVSSLNLKKIPAINQPLLGSYVPIAGYGLPGTKKLRNNIGKELKDFKGHAVIMAHHGALMFAESYEETFAAANQLEAACTAFIQKKYLKDSGTKEYTEEAFYQYYVTKLMGGNLPVLKSLSKPVQSKRLEDGFLYIGEVEKKYNFSDQAVPSWVKIHQEIYKNRPDINHIMQNDKLCLLGIAAANTTLRPLLDDFAQIVGSSSRCAESSDPAHIVKALKGRLGVLVPGIGALCCAASLSDAQAVSMVMQKDAYAQINGQLFGGANSLSAFDCRLMHFVYTKSYSKKASGK